MPQNLYKMSGLNDIEQNQIALFLKKMIIIDFTRYIIPLDNELKVEIDIFKDFFNDVCFAEIEYESEEQAHTYKVPEWLGEDISNQKRVKNGYMAFSAKSIEEYKDLLLK